MVSSVVSINESSLLLLIVYLLTGHSVLILLINIYFALTVLELHVLSQRWTFFLSGLFTAFATLLRKALHTHEVILLGV